MAHRAPRVSPVLTGALTMVVIVVVLVGVVISGLPGSPIHLPWNSQVVLKAQLADADSLEPHASVEIAGVKIGEVQSIDGNGSTSIATMNVESKYAGVHRDATVMLRPHGFFGPKFLEIVPGTASAPMLDSGALIPERQTVLPVDLDQILHALGAPERQSLQTAIVELGQAAAGRGDDVNHLVGAARVLTSTLLDPVQTLDNLRPKLSDMLIQNESFNADFAQVPLDQLVANTNSTLGAFAANSGHLESLLTHADNTLTSLDAALNGEGGSIRSILEQAPGVVDRLDQFNDVLGAFGANLRGLQPGQPVDATPGIIGAIENVRSAFASSDPCSKNPGQACSPLDNREHYGRVEIFGLLPSIPIPCSVLPAPLSTLPCTASTTTRPMDEGAFLEALLAA